MNIVVKFIFGRALRVFNKFSTKREQKRKNANYNNLLFKIERKIQWNKQENIWLSVCALSRSSMNACERPTFRYSDLTLNYKYTFALLFPLNLLLSACEHPNLLLFLKCPNLLL